MGKLIGGSNVSILLGANNISSYFNDASTVRDNDLQGQLETFGDSAKEYGVGLLSGNAALTGLYDDTAAAIDAVLNTAFAAAAGNPFAIAPALTTVGRSSRFGTVREANYNINNGSAGEYQKLVALLQADGGMYRGVILHGLTAETGTVNGTSVDGGAASTNGARAGLWVPTATVTTVTVVIQDSANDVDFLTIGTFTAVTGTTSEIITIAGQVRQYTRFAITSFTGTTLTPLVTLART